MCEGGVWCVGVRSLLFKVRAAVARSFRLFTKKKYERSEFLLRQAQAVNKPRPRRAHRLRTRCASTI